MNKWDKYKISEDNNDEKWNKYKVKNVEHHGPSEDSWKSLIGKSALKGLTSIADLPKVGAILTENVLNSSLKAPSRYADKDLHIYDYEIEDDKLPQFNFSKYIPSTEDGRKSLKKVTGIDLEPRSNSPAKNIVKESVDFGAAMTPWGLASKANKGVSLFNKFKNLKKPVLEGAGVGLAGGALKEAGVDPLVADVSSSFITPGTLKNIPITLKNIPKEIKNSGKKLRYLPHKSAMKIMGLTPGRLNLPVAHAARDLGIDLPATVLTDGVMTGLADQIVGKTPFIGNILKDKYNKVQDKTYDSLKQIYKEIGPENTPETIAKNNSAYRASRKELPKGAKTKPTNAVEAFKNIESFSDTPTPDEIKLKRIINSYLNKYSPKITSKFGEVKLPVLDSPVKNLLDTKKSLNTMIEWDIPGETINQLKAAQKAMLKDIAEYGIENPEWYKKFRKAEDQFAKTAKRQNVETILRNEATVGNPEDLSYANIARTINDKKKRRIIEKQVPPETYEKILKLGTVARAMVQKNRRVPNPSGTAATLGTIGVIGALYSNPLAFLSSGGASGIGLSAVASKLLTDKKFIDLAIKFAEEGGKDKLKTQLQLNKRAKEVSGYTLNSIYRNLKNDVIKEDIE